MYKLIFRGRTASAAEPPSVVVVVVAGAVVVSVAVEIVEGAEVEAPVHSENSYS